jgi:hypothetical protein
VRGSFTLIAVAALAAGCAQAGSPNAPADARGTTHDAPRETPMDAPAMTFMDAAMTGDSCTTTIACTTATALPQITGDDGGGTTTASATGYQAAWFSIRVAEEDSGFFGYPMSMLATLTSPASAMFDLYVYMPGDASSTDCSSPTGTATTSGSTESWTQEWGETGEFGNDSDDSRTVSIEVRPRAGITCSATATWSLSIEGYVD